MRGQAFKDSDTALVLQMDRESWAFSSVEILKGRAIQDGEAIRALQ
jgi:hypothetical protein